MDYWLCPAAFWSELIFHRSGATNQLSAASPHLSVLQHRNWIASISVVDPDDYEVAKLYFEYWRTCYRLYFYLSWFSTDHEQRTNCPRRAFIFRFYNIGIGEPPIRLLNLTITKSLSFISNIGGLLTLPVCIWVDFSRITRNLENCCSSLHLSVLQHKNWRATSSGVETDDYKVAKLYFEYSWTSSSRLSYEVSYGKIRGNYQYY